MVPVLPLGIVMRRLPTRVADALAWPMVRSTVGDVTKVGLKKLPYGPNTQIVRDHRVPLLDIGTMDQIKQGRITVHGDLDRFTEDGVVFTNGSQVTLDAVVWPPDTEPPSETSSSAGKPSVTVRGRRRNLVRP